MDAGLRITNCAYRINIEVVNSPFGWEAKNQLGQSHDLINLVLVLQGWKWSPGKKKQWKHGYSPIGLSLLGNGGKFPEVRLDALTAFEPHISSIR